MKNLQEDKLTPIVIDLSIPQDQINESFAVEDLSARVWELEQKIHELCKIERQKNENSIQNK